MGDVSAEPSMEEILSSIKRVIEESEAAPAARKPRPIRAMPPPPPVEREEVLELSDPAPFPEAPVEKPRAAPAPARPDSILSPDAAEASRGPLEALSRLVIKPEVTGSDTLEGMVREMLRPMLRDWLDTHLPDIVETMVAKEIARISGRGL
ncbi:DUF2497 domain-containing protein [Sphingomonas sp.]|uniref:DUF2497 domain-containing protein n=1 Tax=Sphingomonas sp. TaxID=28214 RepID=UPI002B58D62B|nr:DUF2497 domain-containing protein [Sphingomonas sp.]HWK37013.1 DUF2497 domain-containing protein [Sphingomonas sp.]